MEYYLKQITTAKVFPHTIGIPNQMTPGNHPTYRQHPCYNEMGYWNRSRSVFG